MTASTLRQALLASVVGTGLVLAGSAQAAPVSSLFVFGANQASDEDRELLINRVGGATIVDVGDSLRGVATFNTLNSGSANVGGLTGNNELTVVFQALVTGKVCAPGLGCTFTFGADPAFEADLDGGQGNQFAFVPGAGALFAFFEDNPDVNVDLGGDAGNPEAAIATGADGTHFFTLGFTGPGGTAAPGQFFNARVDTDDISIFSSVTSGQTLGNGNFAVGITDNGSFPFTVLPITPCFNPVTVAAGLAEFCGSVSLRGISDLDTPFDVATNINASFFVVPEPASLVILGMGLLGLGAGLRRRFA